MFIVSQVILWIIISTIINAYLMTLPIPVLQRRDFPANYLIQQNNRIDFQKNNECAAFSTAYLLRHFGMEDDGEGLYTHFPSKTRVGTVYPKGIRTVLRKKGFKTKYHKGNVSTLKYEVSKGTPVIVFIKTQKDRNYLHFVPVVGYDKEYIYLSESIKKLVNCDDVHNRYNRKVPINEFKKLWNVKRIHMLLYSNTYIAVDATQSS
ncbi:MULTISPECIES: cysteine peptidase family C39 domain-containing protein [Lysinibacillus]|uniref:Cysteine peptidase family C39 domain-containing protein n=1 Tax=Lysinibacillus capsici TaxID=2115968 RepID=A0ABY8KHK4_9BACI|nr:MULTISPECIES: cysteine peptidase family C39 domain-containing protein [Lysinibacillus]MCT1542013.1 cysteine peptidase family C39 domain-containing protein [Lysinibacillus capsici]MCT1573277.1 cysteine peptidase family C39 domain-containing protein [Lysinibacillus capsici]MCT1650288.1 cysteine peptidase family C39 domain-containing protein [Lysinibacillus capsici]MCT1728673.1 cysteine peptidase family C39 domain-containing protein [Lysinibacillus capsici]MCT1786544.1 cysteine peptidase famil